MNTDQFAYWLQGYSEITGGRMPSESEWQIIQDHLKLVFVKKTPVYHGPSIASPALFPKDFRYDGAQITC